MTSSDHTSRLFLPNITQHLLIFTEYPQKLATTTVGSGIHELTSPQIDYPGSPWLD